MVRDVSLMVNIYKNPAGSIQVCLNKTTKATATQFLILVGYASGCSYLMAYLFRNDHKKFILTVPRFLVFAR